ncbi:hypothetical protein B9057_07750 [Aestuarium zhoushanense]|nr:hypothetical protein B9057_07750 [Aestuarium zhoushanense]
MANVVAALLLYFAIFFRDSVAQFFPNSVFLAALAAGFLILVARPRLSVSYNQLWFLFGLILFLVINSSQSSGFVFSNYVLAPIVAFFIAKEISGIFLKLLLFHMILSVLIQGYEHLSGEFLFVTVAEEGSLLTAEFFSGAADVFRAKGMFQGPLNAVGFYIIMILIFPGLRIPVLALVGSILAYGRLGILVSSTLVLNQLFAASGLVMRIFLLGAVPVLGIALVSVYLQDTFLLAAFDPNSSGNLARVYYWTESFRAYLGYPLWNILFDRLGYANAIGIFPESDFLRLLLDCGLVGFLIYFFMLVRLFGLLRRERKMGSVLFWVVVVCMSVFPFIQSLNAAVAFWFMFFCKSFEQNQRLS